MVSTVSGQCSITFGIITMVAFSFTAVKITYTGNGGVEGAGDLSLPLILLSPPQDSLYQTIPFKWKYCPVRLISDLIQAWLLQFYPLWPSIMFTEPATKSSKQCWQTCKRKLDHVTPLLEKLHWLPVEACIHYKTATLAFRHFENSLPPNLSELLHTYQLSRTLRSSGPS